MSHFENAWDNALRLGHENRRTIELARRHCLNMEFVESSGRGMAEAETGLPSQRAPGPVPRGDWLVSANLMGIATHFYPRRLVTEYGELLLLHGSVTEAGTYRERTRANG